MSAAAAQQQTWRRHVQGVETQPEAHRVEVTAAALQCATCGDLERWPTAQTEDDDGPRR